MKIQYCINKILSKARILKSFTQEIEQIIFYMEDIIFGVNEFLTKSLYYLSNYNTRLAFNSFYNVSDNLIIIKYTMLRLKINAEKIIILMPKQKRIQYTNDLCAINSEFNKIKIKYNNVQTKLFGNAFIWSDHIQIYD